MTSNPDILVTPERPESENPYLKTFSFEEVQGMPLEAFSFQTPAWYVLFSFIAILLVWGMWLYWKRWKANVWRREAIAALKKIHANAEFERVPVLLKATTLLVFPREQVASLTGEAWLNFLDETLTEKLFENTDAGRALLKLAYQSADSCADHELIALHKACLSWFENTRPGIKSNTAATTDSNRKGAA